MIEVFHAYKNGYDTLPKLNKISSDNFISPISPETYKNKLDSLKKQICFTECGITKKAYDSVNQFIKNQIQENDSTFYELALKTEEDLVIQMVGDHIDWTAATMVCFPAGWRPEEIVGKSYLEVHKHIPMNLSNSHKLLQACVNNGPYERFLWGLTFDESINQHPDNKTHFDEDNICINVRVERQRIYGFPEANCFLFALKQFYIKESEIDKLALINSLENLNEAQLKYKGYNKEMIGKIKQYLLPI